MEAVRWRSPGETHFLAQVEEHRRNSEKMTHSGQGRLYITGSTPPFVITGGSEKLPSPGNHRGLVASGALGELPAWAPAGCWLLCACAGDGLAV